MVVDDVMVKTLYTIGPAETLERALHLMVEHEIRHLPVIDGKELLGIITESDIRGAFIGETQPASPLDPARMKIRDHMTRDPLVVFPETSVEDAALMIYQNKIGALPVVNRSGLVGIISIMDLLGLFVDMMGILHSSSRIDVSMHKDPQNFEKVSGIIHEAGMSIISVGMAPHKKSDLKRVYFFRVDLCETKGLVHQIEKAGFEVINAVD
ncbi:MAG: CBS and ACT domain-containing protein [Nitrospinaceae bacterium]